MKDNIERLFKESLEDYAMPYNGAAWEALSKKLDAAATPVYKKWWFAASIVAVAALSSLLFIQDSKTTQEKPSSIIVSNTTDSKPATLANAEKQGDGTEVIPQNAEISETAVAPSYTTSLPSDNIKPSEQRIEPMPFGQQIIFGSPGPADMLTKSAGTPSSGSSVLSLPKTVCLNDEIEIVNPNKDELVVVTQPNGRQTGVKAGGKSTVNAATAGIIRVVSGSNSYNIEVIKPEGNLYISQISDSPFENGIPEIRLEASGEENVSWSTNAASFVQKGKTLIVHPFKEMDFEVTATSKDAQGCMVTEKKTIRLEEKYNLLAENAFNPSSSIPRNRSFMPEALTLRDVAFELSIIDPKTGSVVYETSDAAQGWEGNDKRNGETVRANSIWLWKVVIKNPLPGEPRVYNGTVQVVENK